MSNENELIYNLFSYATSELSHTALWTWILRCADSNDEKYSLPKRIALSFFKEFIDPDFEIGDTFEVTKEYKHKEEAEAVVDIFVENEIKGKTIQIVLENKIKDVITPGQIGRIESSFRNDGNIKFVLLNTEYDFMIKGLCKDINETVRILEEFKGWKFVGIEHIIGLLNEFKNEMSKSDIIKDYYDWLIYKNNYILGLEEKAFSGDYEDVECALSKLEGQWFFLKSIFSGINGIQYNGNNTGGTPWTQFRFFELSIDDPEYEEFRGLIFYRIDRTKREGYYLRLNIYHRDGILEREKPVLNDLRVCYENIMNSIPLETKTIEGYTPKENKIGEILIKDNSPNEIKAEIPFFHGKFKQTLISKGWPERGFVNLVQSFGGN